MSKVLVYWICEKKTSIEDVDTVFENDRFVGNICQVLWKGNNSRYAAEIIRISGKWPIRCLLVDYLPLIL